MNPIVPDDRLWRLPLADGLPAGPREVVFRTDGVGGLDGLAMDARGRIYIAANREGRLWRYDPADGSAVVVADQVEGIASLAFGVRPFDETALFASQLRGGHVWSFPVDTRGAPLHLLGAAASAAHAQTRDRPWASEYPAQAGAARH